MKATSPSSLTETRERLLQTGVVAFGRRDYDGVSTREIAEAAGANISAISYHFGGKRGLYLATVEYLAEQLHSELSESLAAAAQAIDHGDPAACTDVLCDFVGDYLDLLLNNKRGDSAHGILFREHNQPTGAYEILYRKLLQPLHSTLTRLVSCCRGEPQENCSAILLAHALLGQTIFFSVARTTLLKRLDKPAYTTSDIAQLKRELNRFCRCLLDAPQERKDAKS
ncbi:MAG: CerR family C-terminal domain-containing protein [Candidatus Thiodiazotropha sp.]